ncbi:MAG: ABC transporter ATP-binding protein [Mycobacteriales bacterium]
MSMGMHGAGRGFASDRSVTEQQLARGTFRRVVRFAQPFRRLLLWFLITVIVDSALVVATPLLLQRVIDRGVIPGDVRVVVETAFLVALVALADAVLSMVETWLSSRVGEGMIYRLRGQVFAHVQRMPLAFFTRTQTGSLVSRLNSDVIGAQQTFTSTLGGIVSSVVSLIAVLITMFTLSWPITLIALVILPVFLFPARHVGKRLSAISREAMQLNAGMSQTMTERFNVAGALLVKVFGRLPEESAVFDASAAKVRDIGVRRSLYGRVLFTVLTLVAAIATAVVYGVGGVFAIHGELKIGALVAMASLLSRLYGPLTQLSNVQVTVMTALVSFDRVFEVLDLEPMIGDAPGASALPAGSDTISFEHVRFRYPSAAEVSLASLESVAKLDTQAGVEVLRDVDFTVRPGEMVALVGPSGAGKTTITHLVSRFYDPTEGVVRIGGHDLRTVTQESLHEVVGVVTQDPHMFHDTIRANLLLAKPDASDAEVREAVRAAYIADLVESLPDGLDTVVGDRGYRLSGGEKQRLAIARLLLKSPAIVVLDEATAHLDSESEAAVQRALAVALSGRTSLVIAHRLATIRDADTILVVDDGRIVASGPHNQLLAEGGLYADLYRTQFADQGSDRRAVSTPAS